MYPNVQFMLYMIFLSPSAWDIETHRRRDFNPRRARFVLAYNLKALILDWFLVSAKLSFPVLFKHKLSSLNEIRYMYREQIRHTLLFQFHYNGGAWITWPFHDINKHLKSSFDFIHTQDVMTLLHLEWKVEISRIAKSPHLHIILDLVDFKLGKDDSTMTIIGQQHLKNQRNPGSKLTYCTRQ